MKQYNIINRSVHYRMDVLPSSSQHAHSWYKRSHRLSILQGSEIDSDHREFGQHKNIYTMRSKKTNRIWTNTCIDIRTPPHYNETVKCTKSQFAVSFFFMEPSWFEFGSHFARQRDWNIQLNDNIFFISFFFFILCVFGTKLILDLKVFVMGEN